MRALEIVLPRFPGPKHVLQAMDMKNGEVGYGYDLGEAVDACVSCHTHFRPRLPAK